MRTDKEILDFLDKHNDWVMIETKSDAFDYEEQSEVIAMTENIMGLAAPLRQQISNYMDKV